jgi:hypothetical protein
MNRPAAHPDIPPPTSRSPIAVLLTRTLPITAPLALVAALAIALGQDAAATAHRTAHHPDPPQLHHALHHELTHNLDHGLDQRLTARAPGVAVAGGRSLNSAVLIAVGPTFSGHLLSGSLPTGLALAVRAAAPMPAVKTLDQALTSATTWVVGILATAATFFLTLAGARRLMSNGDPGEIEKSKTALKSAALGYALALLAPVFVDIVKSILGA